MKSWVRNSLRAGVLAAGFLLFAASPAHAGDQYSANNSGIGTGNNVSVPIAVAANACGNGVGVAGVGVGVSDKCAAGASNEEAGDTQVSHDNSGIASGNNVSAPISAAGNLCGNGVGVAGAGIGVSDTCGAGASNESGSSYRGMSNERAGRTEGGKGGGLQYTADNSGILTGNNISIPIAAALNACGNGVGVAGVGVGVSDTCKAGASNENATEIQYTAGNSGILTGNNVSIPISLAANVCGNGVGVLGVGVGVSDTCKASASNNGEKADRHAVKSNRHMNRTSKGMERTGESTEALPAVSAPLPSPVKDVAERVLGSAPNLSAPTQGNSLNLPV